MGHSHAPAGHVGGRYRNKLRTAFVLIALFFVVELVYGLLSHSLALLSDAGHMAADVVALGAALTATTIASKPDTTGRRTYGSYRVEVFASGLAVLLMLGVAVYVVVEALGRIGSTPDVHTMPMIVVGGLGLIVNVIVLFMLREGASESLNVKGAYLEVVADTAGSVGVVAAGLIIKYTGMIWMDTLIALCIGIFVAVRGVMLGRQVLAVLGQHVPEGLDVDDVDRDLREVDGVRDVHDLHIWVLTSGMNVATAHLVTEEIEEHSQILLEAQELLKNRYRVEHATLQLETTPTRNCEELTW